MLRIIWTSLLLVFSTVTGAATLVVTSAADTAGSTCTSTCTLRQAITAANATTAADTINFNIGLPVRGEILISPATALPEITQPLTINGYSQSGTSVNSDTQFNNAKLRIRIDGAAAPANTDGLNLCAANITLRGLILTRFSGDAISVGFNTCLASGAQIRGNYIGLTAAGVLAENATGIDLSDGPTVGGTSPQDQNVIVDVNRAITIRNSGANLLGNLINVLPDGQIVSGVGSASGSIGILNSVSNSSIGVGAINKIGFSNVGIRYIADAASLNNSHFSNAFLPGVVGAGLAVDLGGDGVTPNDANDLDTGPNGLQNFPELLSASRVSAGLSVTGRLDVGHPGSLPYGIALYASGTCGELGHGPGERFLGQTTVTLSSVSENFAFTQTTTDTLPAGTVITAVATRTGVGSSEFSACFNLDAAPLVVNVTDDVGDGVCNPAHCSLRDAIIVANNAGAPQRIHFAIPGSGELVIQPATELPQINQTVTIDGYTQSGAAPNTESMASAASNAVLRIRLHDAGQINVALQMCGANSIVRGLAITSFTIGIRGCEDVPIAVEGSFIGLASDGVTAGGNSTGVILTNLVGRVGGSTPAQRNVIASNVSGVTLFGSAASGSTVLGNLFGTDKSGLISRANTSAIELNQNINNARIGAVSAPNRIRGGNFGIALTSSAGLGNTLANNSFVDQTIAAIDLGKDGITLNDPGDADTGPNELLNFPELSLAQRTDTGIRVAGTISREPGVLTLYASRACHSAGHGGGEHIIAANFVPANFDGTFISAIDFAKFPVITATNTFADSTSEFSACITVTEQPAGIAVDSTDDASPNGGCEQTGDSNACTLREAILLANAQSGSDVIRFAIPGDGPHVLQPLSNLPVITGGLLIDGYSEFGAVPNAAETGSDAVLMIELLAANSTHVLRTCTTELVDIRGLAIHGGTVTTIATQSNDNASCSAIGSLRLRGSWLGLNPDGTPGIASSFGVLSTDTRLTLGGPELADRNVFANTTIAVRIAGVASNLSSVQNNLFGLNPELIGGASFDNTRDLDLVNVSGVVVGGEAGLANRFNQSQVAIFVSGVSADGNTLYANHFANHTGATAIDLSDTGTANGINPNDLNDADTGANEGQNTAVLSDGTADSSTTVINGTLDVPVGITTPSFYRLALYRSATCNDSTSGREGEQYLGSILHGFTSAAENFSMAVATPPLSGFLTMTVTTPDGSTSEFSNCLAAPQPQIIFRSGFEG